MEKNQNLNTKSNDTTMTVIYEAGLAKRLFAAIIDFLMGVFVWLFLAMVVMTPIANKTLNYSNTMYDGMQYQIASHLYLYKQADDAGNYSYVEPKDFTEKLDSSKNSKIVVLAQEKDVDSSYLLNHLYYYYTSYLTGENIELPNDKEGKHYDAVSDKFVAPNYNIVVKDTETLPKDYYTTKWFNETILLTEEGQNYFETADINVLCGFKADIDITALNNYLSQKLYAATKDFYYSDYMTSINKTLKGCQLFIVLPPLAVVLLLVYMLPMLLFKNGETLGKKFLKIGIISSNNFSAKKRQYLFRFIVFAFEICLCLFIVGVGNTSIATLGIGILLLFIATLISKRHRSLHDFAAMTVVVDTQKSVWFNSKEDEEKHLKELNEHMDKYRSVKVQNKNIIQIGSEIVDEDIKREIEENSKKE